VLIIHVATRLGQCEKDSSTTRSDDEKENSAKLNEFILPADMKPIV